MKIRMYLGKLTRKNKNKIILPAGLDEIQIFNLIPHFSTSLKTNLSIQKKKKRIKYILTWG